MNDRRVLLLEVNVFDDDPTMAKVTLKLGEQIEWGESNGEKKQVLTLIGQATLIALNKILPRSLEAKLDYVEAVNAQREGTPQVALSLIRFRELQKEVFLNGSCPISEDPYNAAAKSVLDALNRKIDVELQRANLRARATGALVATSDMDSIINREVTQTNSSGDGQGLSSKPVSVNKEVNVVEDALNLERAANLSSQGYSASMKGNYEQAAFFYQQATELEPNNAKYHYELGLVLSKSPDKKRETRISLKRAVELSPDDATYAKELEYFDRGEQLERLPSPEKALDKNDKTSNEEPSTGMQKKVSNKVAGLVIGVLLTIAIVPLALFYIFSSDLGGDTTEQQIMAESSALSIVFEMSSVEKGKTVKEKADEIIQKEGIGKDSNNFWIEFKDKTNQTMVIFAYTDKNKKPQEASWLVNLEKRFARPNNPGAEAISGKVGQ